MKVLLIDDNEDITEAVSFYLQTKGITCEVINEGKQGLEVMKRKDFDAIILDLAMPEFSGQDIINELKKQDLLKSKNIIVFTASSLSDKDFEDILKSGINAVIRKPLSIEELEEAIEKFRPYTEER